MRCPAPQAHRNEGGSAEMQRWHGGNGQLEAVVRPGGSARTRAMVLLPSAMQDVYEAILVRKQAWRHASIAGEDHKRNPIVQRDSTTDATEERAWQTRINVHEKADAERYVRVINVSQNWHQPGVKSENSSLKRLLDRDTQMLL